MAESTIVRTKRDGIIAITDGTRTYTVAYEPGNFTADIPDVAVNLFLDRGVIGTTPSIRKGDEAPMSGSFSAYMRDILDTAGSPTYVTLLDLCLILSGEYAATTWVSTIGASSDVTTWTLTWLVDGTFAGESDKTMTFTFTVLRAKISEGDPNMIEVSWTSYQKHPTIA